MKKCELCKFPARSYCESDEASLCWSCDAKVHGANFLVARHTRSLLCGTCQSLTPWTASGAKLISRTVCVCDKCANVANRKQLEEKKESEAADNDDLAADDLEGDNQVVPWSSLTPPPPPPPAASSSFSSSFSSSSCSSSQEYCESGSSKSLKRKRQSSKDLQDDVNRSGFDNSGR